MNHIFPEISTPAQRLAAAIEGSKLNQRQLSTASGVPNSTISDILSGKNARPAYEKMRALGMALNVSTDWLFGHGPSLEPARRPPPALPPSDYTTIKEEPAVFGSPSSSSATSSSLWRKAVAGLPAQDLLHCLTEIIQTLSDTSPPSKEELAEIRWALDTLTKKITTPTS